MTRPIRVHLTGTEISGWALDADVATTRTALLALEGQVELTSLEDADVVHSVWEEAILRLDSELLAGKRTITHLCNELTRIYEMPIMTRVPERVSIWIARSDEAETSLRALGLRCVKIPYAVDTTAFTEEIPGGEDRAKLRERYSVPQDAYIISTFMRDSRAGNLQLAKPQKGVELLVAILKGLRGLGLPVHALLGGPRRHNVRARLREAGVPFTFVGREVASDDVGVNLLSPDVVNLLYHVSDLHIVTSRWEGGPRAVLEAGVTRTPIISTPVGIAGDVLEPRCIFRSVDEGIDLIAADVNDRRLATTLEPHLRRIHARYLPEATVPLLRELYAMIATLPGFQAPTGTRPRWRPVASRVSAAVTTGSALARAALGYRPRQGNGLRIGLWHEFHEPPYGGGNQFMHALEASLHRQGARVVRNTMSPSVDAHICNSAWFDIAAFERAARQVRMIHRVDGPVAMYRGTDWAEDERIHRLNREHASATVFQSAYSFREMKAHGLDFVRPMIIRNAPDPTFFHPPAERRTAGRKLRLIATAWSDNPAKGGPLFKWLDAHLDWSRFEFTFVGRIQQEFQQIRHVPPQDSRGLGELLRQHDLYIAASRNDPCSNALLEALACGLPALYLDEGGHGELVGHGGLPFKNTEDVLPQLDRLAASPEAFRSCIWVQTIDEIARQYIELARLLEADLP
jgi:glycosyltransferase involved in cell wall biosynthesis